MNISQKKRLSVFIFCFLSLIISYILGENSSGGSKLDSRLLKGFVDSFSENFKEGLIYYIKNDIIHFPTFYFILGSLKKLVNINILSIFYIIISSLIPYIFYSTLKKIYKDVNKNILFAISILIFLSPYFRSSAVWITNDNLALLFFVLSLNKFSQIIFEKNNKFFNFLTCITWLILASYIRQYYCLFAIIFIFKTIKYFSYKEILISFILFLILSLPAFIYLGFLFKNKIEFSYVSPNYLKNLIVFLSIYFFYIFPVFLSQINLDRIKKFLYEKKIIIILTFIIFIFLYFKLNNINFLFGGGAILKLSNLLDFPLIFYLSVFGSIILIIFYSNKIIEDIILLSIIFFSFPFEVIYQKYFDPLILLIFFIMIKPKFLSIDLKNENFNLKILYFFHISFLIFANYNYSV